MAGERRVVVRGQVVGQVTRGTTNPNRLRRVDRWIVDWLGRSGRRELEPVIVDVGFGSSVTTTVELARRVRAICPGAAVVGVEIDPLRVASAQRQLAALPLDAQAGVRVVRGGFDLACVPEGSVAVVRAANVLRQYDEAAVLGAWELLKQRLAPGGVIVDATCDEVGRVGTWLTVTARGPESLTFSLSVNHLADPMIAATRLPKFLIHRNVAGQRVREVLVAMSEEWQRQAALAVFGPRFRWRMMCQQLAEAGWPVIGGDRRWRLGELTVGQAAFDGRLPHPLADQ